MLRKPGLWVSLAALPWLFSACAWSQQQPESGAAAIARTVVAEAAPLRHDDFEEALVFPSSSAQTLLQAAWSEISFGDNEDARQLLQQAQQIKAPQEDLWAAFAHLDIAENRMNDAVADFHKEIQSNPANRGAYLELADLQLQLRQNDAAIATLVTLFRAHPADIESATRASSLLIQEKKFSSAAALLRNALRQNPGNNNLAIDAARAEILAGNRAAGTALLLKAADGADDAVPINAAAVTLSELTRPDLPLAQKLCERALDIAAMQTVSLRLTSTRPENLQTVYRLTSLWDTAGWIYFEQGKTALAESYVHAAWTATESPRAGYHLGQIYEKEGRPLDAAAIYRLATVSDSADADPSLMRQIAARLKVIAREPHQPLAGRAEEENQLDRQRSISLAPVSRTPASADFYVLLSAGRADAVQFIRGDQSLKLAADALQLADYSPDFPSGSTARVLRRGTLTCPGNARPCQFTMVLTQRAAITPTSGS